MIHPTTRKKLLDASNNAGHAGPSTSAPHEDPHHDHAHPPGPSSEHDHASTNAGHAGSSDQGAPKHSELNARAAAFVPKSQLDPNAIASHSHEGHSNPSPLAGSSTPAPSQAPTGRKAAKGKKRVLYTAGLPTSKLG